MSSLNILASYDLTLPQRNLISQDVKKLVQQFSAKQERILNIHQSCEDLLIVKHFQCDSEGLMEVLKLRFRLSFKFAKNLGGEHFNSLQWAKKNHPNKNFVNSLSDNYEKIIAVVNWFGFQNNEDLEYIRDNQIYLSKIYFTLNQKERVSTLLHEISHLVGVSEQQMEEFSNLIDIFAAIPTSDTEEPMYNAYVWEQFFQHL